ncbi:MAG: ABC transporter permease subunit [Gemmatimonadaceae bacterium]|nr:ABC transporter permease subunit [Gemmatimonadaceae bacterium]
MTSTADRAAIAGSGRTRAVGWTTLLAHEWRLLARDRVLHVAVAVFAAVVIGALVTGARWTAAQRTTIAALHAEEDSVWAAARRTLDTIPADAPRPDRFSRDPRVPFHVGQRLGRVATLDPAPLAALAVGQSDLQPSYYRVTTGPRQAMLQREELEHPVALLTGRLDLAFVVTVLLPLLIGALCHGLIAGEREDGTLALVAAQPVSLRRVVLAKVLVRAAVVGALAIALVAVGLAVVGVPLGAPGTVSLVAAWFVVVLAQATLWFGLAVLIGARAPSAAAGTLVLAASWLVLVIVVPVLTGAVAQARWPAPSRAALITETRATSALVNARGDSVLGRYLVDHPELTRDAAPGAGQDFVARTLSVQFELDTTLAPRLSAFDAQVARQQEAVERARVLSPALLVQGMLESLAGTDGSRWRAFRDGVVTFHGQWRTAIMRHVLRDDMLDGRALAALPVPPSAQVDAPLSRIGTSLMVLLAQAGLVWAAALMALRRLRPVAA